MSKALPIWSRYFNGKHKPIGELTDFEREAAHNKCSADVKLGRHTAVKIFIERMEFKAEERLANGQDSDFQE